MVGSKKIKNNLLPIFDQNILCVTFKVEMKN